MWKHWELRATEPAWHVILHPDTAAQDITRRLSERLVSLVVTCQTSTTADQLDLVLSDTEGNLQIPPTGAVLAISLGATPERVALLGHFTVDELEYTSPPRRLRITGRATNVASAWHEKKERSWSDLTLGTLAATLAQHHDLALSITAPLADIALGHVDQTNESDLNLITRLAKQYGANATVKASQLLILGAGATESATGKALPAIHINERDTSQWRWTSHDRTKYTGVCARWHDKAAANQITVTAGQPGCLFTLEDTYPDQQSAVAAAANQLAQFLRGSGQLDITLPQGDTTRQPGAPCTLSGFHPLIDATAWRSTHVTHRLDSGGYTQQMQLEVMGK